MAGGGAELPRCLTSDRRVREGHALCGRRVLSAGARGLDAATEHQSRSRPAAAWCGSLVVRPARVPGRSSVYKLVNAKLKIPINDSASTGNDFSIVRVAAAARTPRARLHPTSFVTAGAPRWDHNSEFTSMPAGSAVWGAATSLRRQQHCYLQLGRQGHPRGRRRRGPRGKAPQESRRHRQCSVRRAVCLARTREPLDTRVGDANLLQ